MAEREPCLCGCGEYPLEAKSRFVASHDNRMAGLHRRWMTGEAEPTEEQKDYLRKRWGSEPVEKYAASSEPLDDKQVREIRRRAADGETGAAIARDLDLSKNAIYGIIRRKTYKGVPDEEPAPG